MSTKRPAFRSRQRSVDLWSLDPQSLVLGKPAHRSAAPVARRDERWHRGFIRATKATVAVHAATRARAVTAEAAKQLLLRPPRAQHGLAHDMDQSEGKHLQPASIDAEQ